MEHSSLNMIDLAVFGVILLSGLMAFIRGFVREALSLGSWTAASLAALHLYPYAKPYLHKYIHNENMANIASGTIVFCVVLALFIPLGMFLGSLVRGKALTAIDRSLGFVFGLMRGVLIACLLFLITLWVWQEPKDEPTMLVEARTRPLLAYGAGLLKDLIPKEEIDQATSSLQKIDIQQEDIDRATEAKDHLEKLTTPVPTSAPAPAATNNAPAYDNATRYGLNKLIDKDGKP